MFLKTLQEMQRLMVHAIKVAKQLPLSDAVPESGVL
jgi:hypothetical protein